MDQPWPLAVAAATAIGSWPTFRGCYDELLTVATFNACETS